MAVEVFSWPNLHKPLAGCGDQSWYLLHSKQHRYRLSYHARLIFFENNGHIHLAPGPGQTNSLKSKILYDFYMNENLVSHGPPRVVIYTIFSKLESPMHHAKFKDHHTSGSEDFFFSFLLNVPVNNFSVMSGRNHRFLGITSTFGR